MSRTLLLALILISFGLTAQEDGDIIWGGPGDPNSEFDGGLNDWTTVNETNDQGIFIWEADGAADQGAYFGGGVPINSMSISNGALVFDSDFYDNGGVQNEFGQGIAPAPTTAELISPIMDLPEGFSISLKFNQHLRQFASTFTIAYSNDGGETWSDPILFNDTYAAGESTAPNSVETVPLLGAVSSANFRVKFIYQANYYFWVIDDVQVVVRKRNDLQVNSNFYAIAPNFMTPISQPDEFGFLVDIRNNGGIDQPNTIVTATIANDSMEIFSTETDYGTVGDEQIENVSFGSFTQPIDTGTYHGRYVISSDSVDIDPSNDTISFSFMMTDTTFAKEQNPTRPIYPAASNWDESDPRQWAYGNHYRMPNGDGFYANTITFSIDGNNDNEGNTLNVILYEWNDLNEDTNVDPDERLLVGAHFYSITGNEAINDSITVPITVFGAPNPTSPSLKDDTEYIAILEFLAIDDTRLDFGASDAFDYGAMILDSEQQGRHQVASVLGIAGNIEAESYSSVGFGRDLVPVVRLNIGSEPLHSGMVSNNNILADNTLNISPNPTTGFVNFQVALDESAKELTINVLDVTGRTLKSQRHQNVLSDKFTMDLRQLPTGTYFVTILTENGTITKKLIVE